MALTAESGPLGWIRLADRPRPEAARVLAELHELGLQTIMLTGDNAGTAAAVARELGVGEQRAGLLPADKVSAIAELDARHGPTGMVGDGVNDAPALAAAKVSIALGGISSGAALESADIVLLADDLGRLPWLIRHSRATLARIRQNIALALADQGLRPDPGDLRPGQPLDGHRRRRRHQPAGHRECAEAAAVTAQAKSPFHRPDVGGRKPAPNRGVRTEPP